MKHFFSSLPHNILGCFKGRLILWHLLAIALTFILVLSGFGFYRGGVFWGWPSSHTTVAFAMAVAVFTLFPKQRLLRLFALVYAFYIGLSVSMTIHWFSDFAAGAIVGSVVGVVVGRSFNFIPQRPVL